MSANYITLEIHCLSPRPVWSMCGQCAVCAASWSNGVVITKHRQTIHCIRNYGISNAVLSMRVLKGNHSAKQRKTNCVTNVTTKQARSPFVRLAASNTIDRRPNEALYTQVSHNLITSLSQSLSVSVLP